MKYRCVIRKGAWEVWSDGENLYLVNTKDINFGRTYCGLRSESIGWIMHHFDGLFSIVYPSGDMLPEGPPFDRLQPFIDWYEKRRVNHA